jgi:molybdopterin molybdotransferase
MGFRGREFVVRSPSSAVEVMTARASARARGLEACPLERALGRVLARSAVFDRDSPAFDHSAMDGYAARAAELTPGVELTVVGEVRVGTDPGAMPAGPCVVRVVTGAGIPAGADTVLRREDAEELGSSVRPRAAARAGDHIRRRGENGRAGSEVVPGGSVITAAVVSSLASVGQGDPSVFGRVRVAVITTGDELVGARETPGPHALRNSNGPAVAAVFGGHAWLEVVDGGHVRDEEVRVEAAVRRWAAGADAVVLTGGVSMGHRDPVRGAVEAAGAEVVFHGVPQKPGKPMLAAVLGATPVFGLPGNPVSALVTATRVVLPVLGGLAGIARWPEPPAVTVANPDGKALELWHHRLVRLVGAGRAELVAGQGSGDLAALGRSDGFVEVPPGESGPGPFAFFGWRA